MESKCSGSSSSADFQWPEPLVIDVIGEHYRDEIDLIDRLQIAKLQQSALRALFEGDGASATAKRRALDAYGAACRITPERIAQADRAVFRELISLVAIQLRTSPRRRAAISSKFHVALSRLAPRANDVVTPVYVPPMPRWPAYAT